MTTRLTPARIVGRYALVAGLWILLSGYALNALVADPRLLGLLEIVKGLGFVAITSTFLYLWLTSWKRQLETADRQARAVLAEREGRLRQLTLAIEQSPESILITDLEAKIEYVNTAFHRTTGYARDEVIGQNPRILQSGKTPPDHYEGLWAALTCGEPWKGEFYNRRKDGSEYVEIAHVAPLRQADGRITHYVAVKQDVTAMKAISAELEQHRNQLEELVARRTAELAEARRQAEAASQAKSHFLANMSHELRTPMNGVLGMVELLGHTPLNADQAEMVATIHESGSALTQLIDDILDFSKIEAGRMTLERAPLDLGALLARLRAVLAPLASRRNLDLECSIAEQVPRWVDADAMRLRQLIYNLAGNAIKFSGGDPERRERVQVSLELDAAEPLSAEEMAAAGPNAFRLRLCVVDHGIGMSTETLAALFTPFVQAEASTTRRFGGTGLGLSICRRLVELMGGRIEVQSTLGQSSTFEVRLPLARAAAATDAQPSAQRAEQGSEHQSEQRHWQAIATPADSALPEALARATTQGGAPHAEDGQAGAGFGTGIGAGGRVLVVEDDAINRRLLRHQLELLGYQADLATNGREALELWHRGRYAAVLTDLHMPEMDGYGLTEQIRREESAAAGQRRVPILALSANALRGAAEQARTRGLDDYLTKPLQLAQLHQTLERWLAPMERAPNRAPEPAVEPAPERAAKPEPPVLDADKLRALVGDDDATLRGLLAEYLKSAQSLATEIDRGCNAGEAAAIAAASHRLKSSSRAVGALALAALCERIEMDAIEAHVLRVRGLMDRFDGEQRRAQAAIEALLDDL